jgi:hypothetical protein
LNAAARFYLLGLLLQVLFRIKKMNHPIEMVMQYLECFILIDVLWASIPLGVLTGYEMIYFNKFGGDGESTLELVKMIALAIDVIGIVYLVYFEILGFEEMVCGSHEHEMSHDVEGQHQEKKPLLQGTNQPTKKPAAPAKTNVSVNTQKGLP